jgi:hypothetical protein
MAKVTFTDGPAAGATVYLARCPIFLRLVVAGEKWDALDQIFDQVHPGEQIEIYYRTKHGFACRGGPGEFAEYAHLPAPQTIRQLVRDNTAWVAWANEAGESGVHLTGRLP